ncbi:MAG: hypothetical protein EBT92_14400 [Planctomycetes bacterium]|nr:hypothetical protein [Planctomycetota bacterium]
MKAKFVKDVTLDVLDTHEELYHKFFRKDDEVQVSDADGVSIHGSQFTNILLMNGDLLLDVPRNSVTIL